MTHHPEVSYHENIEMEEGQLDKEIETNSLKQKDTIEQEYNRLTKTYIDSLELRQQINNSELVHKFLSKNSFK